MNLKRNVLALFFIGIALGGCAGQTNNKMPITSSSAAIPEVNTYSLYKYKTNDELRKVKVSIDASSITHADLKVSYIGRGDRENRYEKNYEENIELIDGRFQGEIDIPVNESAFITGSIEDFTHKIEGYRIIKPDDNNVKVTLTAVSLKVKIREEFKSKSQAEQRKIIQLVGMIGESLNSPRYLAASVIVRAETELELLRHAEIIPYTQYMHSFISSTLSDLKTGVESSSGYMASYGAIYIDKASKKYHLLRLSTI